MLSSIDGNSSFCFVIFFSLKRNYYILYIIIILQSLSLCMVPQKKQRKPVPARKQEVSIKQKKNKQQKKNLPVDNHMYGQQT